MHRNPIIMRPLLVLKSLSYWTVNNVFVQKDSKKYCIPENSVNTRISDSNGLSVRFAPDLKH